MSKRDDDGLAVVLTILIAGLIAIGAFLLWLTKYLYRLYQNHQLKNKPKIVPSSHYVQVAVEIDSDMPVAEAIQDPVIAYHQDIYDAWDRGDYEAAWIKLQKISYTMVGEHVTQQEKDEFKALMTSFASEDPLYRDVMQRIKPLLAETPGLVQSQIYKGQADDIKEKMRYVLYFAEELGEIKRIKKGNSYLLYLPD